MQLRSLVLSGLLLSTVALGSTLLAPTPAQARLRAELEGTVFGFDQDSGQLNVTTRIGPRILLVTNGTQVYLNGRGSAIGSVQQGDTVDVSYDYATSEVIEIYVTRERRRSGTISAATANSIDLRMSGNRQLTMQFDSASRTELAGIAVTDRRVLAGLPATVVFQPGTSNLVLSLAAEANSFKGTIRTITTATRVITVAGTGQDRGTRTVTLDALATLRRNDATAAITEFVVGDQVTVVFVKQGTTRRGLALQGRTGVTPPPPLALP